jgi:hypothetical protein
LLVEKYAPKDNDSNPYDLNEDLLRNHVIAGAVVFDISNAAGKVYDFHSEDAEEFFKLIGPDYYKGLKEGYYVRRWHVKSQKAFGIAVQYYKIRDDGSFYADDPRDMQFGETNHLISEKELEQLGYDDIVNILGGG